MRTSHNRPLIAVGVEVETNYTRGDHIMEIRTLSGDVDLVNERREHIVKCVTPLFVKQTYEATNMHQILEACGMSTGGLYRYISSKEDIRALDG